MRKNKQKPLYQREKQKNSQTEKKQTLIFMRQNPHIYETKPKKT